MSTENSEPIKTLDDWIRRVKELERQLEPAPNPWPFPEPFGSDANKPAAVWPSPDCDGPPDEEPLQGPLP